MKEAIECFHSQKFNESKELFVKKLSEVVSNSEKFEIYKYLHEISIALSKPLEKIHLQNYLHQSFELKHYSNLIKIYNYYQAQSYLNNFELECKYFESLYLSGEIDKSLKVAKKICLKVITEKLYNKVVESTALIEKYYKGYLFYEYCRLIYFIETSDDKKAIIQIEKIIFKVVSEWSLLNGKIKSQKDYIKHLFELIKNFQLQNKEIRKNVLLQRAKLSEQFSFLKLSKKEILEYLVIFSEKPEHFYLIQKNIDDEFLGYDILDYLKQNNIKDEFGYKVKIIKVDKRIKKNLEETKQEVDLTINEAIENLETKDIYKEYGIEHEEVLKSSDLLGGEKNIVEKMNSLLMLGEYSAAHRLADEIENKDLHINMKCAIYQKQNNLIELISFASEKYIETKQVYLLNILAKAYRKNGDDVKSENYESLYLSANLDLKDLTEAFENE